MAHNGNERLGRLLRDDPAVMDRADACCTIGSGNDGSTGFEIFMNGFELGREAGDREVWYGIADGQAWFFIHDGTEESLISRLTGAVAPCPLCGEDLNHPSQHGSHSC